MGKYYDIHECFDKLIEKKKLTKAEFDSFFEWFAERNNYPANGSLVGLEVYKGSIEEEEDEVIKKVLKVIKEEVAKKKNEIEFHYWW